MTRSNRQLVLSGVAAAIVASTLVATTARAERRPPYGMDAVLLEAQVREQIERRIAPLLEQMAPGQAELKYVDVRVTRPTALPAGASPGFEEMTPGHGEFVAEKAEVALVLDSKLPPPFRKDLKNLIKNRLDGLAVPIDIKENVIPFPTPRPQPTTPPELPFRYPPMPQMQQPQPQPAPAAPPPQPAPQPEAAPARGIPTWLAIALGALALLAGIALTALLLGRRRDGRDGKQAGGDAGDAGKATTPTAAAAAADHLPEVRRALREDRVLARRVMSELLREHQIDKVAVAVELVGPSVVEDLRGDPTCAVPLREAAALLVEGRPRTDKETKEIVTQLHRRVLKHRMVGAEDPVEQEFAFLLGLSPQRLSSVLASEPAAVQAAALRYAPAHLRSAYLAERSPSERSALAAALAAPKALSKEHLLDVASTLRSRAADQAHMDTGETGDVDLAVELIEERPPSEQAEMLEAMRRGDPAKARAVQAALISDQSFELVSDEVLTAAAMAVPTEVLGRFLRDVSEVVGSRMLSVLPRTVAASIQEDLSLDVAPTPQQLSDARRAMFSSLRKALRDRGLSAPNLAIASGSDKGKVVAI
jgi:flagellar motor switch protein FliG